MRHVGPAWQRPTADDPDSLIVTFREGTTPGGALSRPCGHQARTRDLANQPGPSRSRPRPGTHSDVIARLQADPDVLSVSVDHRRFLDADPTGEPLWDELWGLENLGQSSGYPASEGSPDADIDGRQALGVTTGDPATVVALIDDGVDFTHPDLADRAWTNPGESGDGRETNGIDDDGNGYIDDVHGWDFCHNDNSVHDYGQDGHGTHVAGTIAGSLNGVGVVGVAPSVSIMALKFISADKPGLRARLPGDRRHRVREVVRGPHRQCLVGCLRGPKEGAAAVRRDQDLGDALRGRGRQ